ncbi:MAG: hypothetical protein NTY36_15395 [Deltaproteobacteria bacterium]|nr:hypothetical protein [Deltaproteobacteria bacterium]
MAPSDFPDRPLQTLAKRLWIHGFLAGLVVVLICFSLWYFIWGSAPEGPEEAKPTISQAPETAPSARSTLATPAQPNPPADTAKPPTPLKAELEAVLTKLAEAQRNKDLSQLLRIYDPTFPGLRQKAEEISRTWKIYDYRSLRFRLEDIRSQSPGTASAKVIWEGETRDRSTHEIKELNKTYLVWFTNDFGQWRIKSLEKTGRPAAQEKS